MQKIIIFVLLGVTLNCVLGEIVAKNFVKAPVQVLSETMATRRYANLRLSSPAPGEIAVNRYTYGIITRSPYRSLNVWERKLDADNLNAISTSNFSFYTTQDPMIYKGYAIVIDDNYDFENSTTSLVVQQWNLKTGESLPAFNIIKVSSDSPAPFYMNSVIHNDTVYVCYSYNSVIYVESFKIGGSSLDKSDGATGFDVYNTLSVDAFNVQMVAGGALPDKRVFVTAIDSGYVYHEASLDITSDRTGSDMMNPDMVGLNCKPYVTDKYYGSFCSNATDNSYYVSINAIGRKLLFTLSGDVTLLGQYSCGDHLVTITQNLTTGGVSYEIWNLETLQSITGKVEFLSGQDGSMDTEIYQAPEGSIYVMLYNSTGSASGTYFQANVGILLENKLPAEYTDDEDMIVEYFLA